MTAIGLRQRGSRTGLERGFYLAMALAMAAVIVAGFAHTVPNDFTGTPRLPVLLHVHGAVFTLWVLLFIAQPALAVRGSLALHRKLGWAGAALAAAMVAMGWTATVIAVHTRQVPPFFPKGVFLVMNILGVTVFGAIVATAVALRRQADWHKRLMLIATVSILGPGLGRALPMQSFGPAAPLVMNGIILAFALAGPVVDLITRRRVHPAYIWGIAVIVVTDVAIVALGMSPLAQAAVAALERA